MRESYRLSRRFEEQVPRLTYLACALGTIVVGLAITRAGHVLPSALRDKLGDALWAIMIYWWISVVTPQAKPWHRGVVAAVVCFAVELSQLYHSPALDALRNTTLGHLVLGNGFDAMDLVAYGAGVTTAVILERIARHPLAAHGASP